MSDEQSNQPRKVKDLKARLGRTIAPATPGGAMPPGVNLPTPPGLGGAPAPAADGSGPAIPPPALPGLPTPPIAAGGNPLLGAPLPGPKAVVEPPMVRQQREEEERRKAEEERRKKRAAADPFAAAAPSAGAAVAAQRVEIDETALQEALAGERKRSTRIMIIATAIAAVAAIFIGKSLGNSMAARRAHNDGVSAAENIARSVANGDAILTQAKAEVDKMWNAGKPDPTNTNPHVDYAALEALLRIENPFKADHFSETRYTVFDPPTVDLLLKYYNSTKAVFDIADRIARSYNIRSPEGRRQLDASFAAARDIAKYPSGCVPALVNNRVVCNMVYTDLEHATATGVPTRTRPTATPTDRALFVGQTFPDNFDKVVIPVNFADQGSREIMGTTLHLHDRYLRDLIELKAALEAAQAARAEFRNELNRIQNLPRQWEF